MSSSRPSPRPRFTLRTTCPPSEVRRRVHALLTADERLRGLALENRLELAIGTEENHFWSPQLVVRVTPREDGGALLEARFGPDPYVWAFYLLAYGMLTIVTIFATIFGLVQWSLGQTPIALWVAPGAATLAGLVYGASFVGQGLGSEQMYLLRSSLTAAVECTEDEPRSAEG